MMKKRTTLSNDDFSVVVFEIQEEDINFDTKKTTTRREWDVIRSFWFSKIYWPIKRHGIWKP